MDASNAMNSELVVDGASATAAVEKASLPATERRRTAGEFTPGGARSRPGSLDPPRPGSGNAGSGACWSEASHCLGGRSCYEAAKRATDIALALIGLIATAPLWVALGAGCLISRSGPLLYAHRRVGRYGVEFWCFKFRTMVVGADAIKTQLAEENHHADHKTFKIRRDPRVTPLGRWLRKFSLDEVPQILNVLLGDMSIVGPRPPLPVETALYSSHDWRRMTVRPGLTCTWQVSGRSEIPFSGQLALDLDYIDRRGMWHDLRLIVLTVPAVISCRGSY